MQTRDVLVAGGGISGASFAFHAARARRDVLVVEREGRVGGCLASARSEQGFWFELGAHTAYNSYGAFLELLEGAGLMAELQPRGKPVLRFLRGDELVPGKNLGLLLRRFDLWELARALPHWFGAKPQGLSVRAAYSRLVGARNYERVLGPMLSAVPSQTADELPADMLFKRRARRADVRRSFTLRGGLRRAVEGALAQPGIETRTGVGVERLERAGAGFAATLTDGTRVAARVVALALPPGAAAELLAPLAPALAAQVRRVGEVRIDSLGFCVRAGKSPLPYATFVIPLSDAFHSIVTRDVVPDPDWRAFTLHFKPGKSPAERLQRACEVLHLAPADLECVRERQAVLPAPRLGHDGIVQEIERSLASEPLALTGNWFGGLAIEDCVLRSRTEWQRVAARLEPRPARIGS